MTFEMVCVGIIAKPVGIKGQVKIHPYTSSPKSLLSYNVFFLADKTEIVLQNSRINEKGDIVTSVKGVADRNAAELLHLKDIFIKKSDLPKLEENEYYLDDLSGLSVVNSKKENIGKVLGALDYGAGVFLDIKLSENNKISTLPFNNISVIDVDLKNGIIQIEEELLLK